MARCALSELTFVICCQHLITTPVRQHDAESQTLHATAMQCASAMSLLPCIYRLDRPENKGLKAYFDKLAQAKEAIDAKSGQVGGSGAAAAVAAAAVGFAAVATAYGLMYLLD